MDNQCMVKKYNVYLVQSLLHGIYDVTLPEVTLQLGQGLAY